MADKPFIYCFKTPLGNYVYDFNTNAIINMKENLYNALATDDYKDETLSEELDGMKKLGFLKPFHWKKIEHPMTFMLPHLLNSSVKSLTLQVTQQCNLKCKYCPYSGSYYNRKHNDSKMTFDIAKKAIDFYVNHSFDMKEYQISFYGGEPLIEFELIQKIVEYADKKCSGKKIIYRMTTNATLLNDEMIRFLMEKKFLLLISLDGPKQYHDKNRHRIDNTGSFDLIMEKIEKIYKQYPDQKENISFNCVIDPQDDLNCVNEFFINNEMLKNYPVFFNQVSKDGIKDKNDFTPDENYMVHYNFEVFKLLYSKTGKIEGINISKIVEVYFNQIKNSFFDRTISNLHEEVSHPSGPCLPGVHKLFVDVEGNFYPCEKVCECSKDMIIGNVATGFDSNKVYQLLNLGNLTEQSCKNCWCSKFCFLCANHVDIGNGLSKEYKLSHCDIVKNTTLADFKDYCLLQEIKGFNEDVFYL